MKKILSFVFCAILICGTLDAQNLLKKLGKAVKKEVTEKVSKEVENVLNGKSTKNPQQSQQPVSVTSQVQKKPVVTDYGENIPRQDGLDYIDEYGINHGGGILIDTVLWAPVNCGYHEIDYPYGKLYQWGRKHGQGYGAPFDREEYNLKPDKTTAVIVPAPVTLPAREFPRLLYFFPFRRRFRYRVPFLRLSSHIQRYIVSWDTMANPSTLMRPFICSGL